MNDDRDRELGAALRTLEVPEHGPSFWDELEERLGSERPGGRLRALWGGGRAGRWPVVLSAAAVLAVVVAAVAVLGPADDATRVRVGLPAATPRQAPWSPLPDSPLAPRSDAVAVWTGERMIVWGGEGADGPLGDGAAYDPATRRWTGIADSPTGPLAGATAVWTGRTMLVWGLDRSGAEQAAAGAAYDPATGTWAPISPPPSRRSSATPCGRASA